jgi:hypothetical protein
MPLLGTNKLTGHVWPGQLECYKIEAPGEEWVVDPALPILSYDPRFVSDAIVIGRGKLVGPKSTATATSSGITQSYGADHKTYLTIADGINVAPVGYAPYNILKDWNSRTNGMAPIMARDHAISVPYLSIASSAETSNSAFGELTQGDKVTAHPGYTVSAATASDPRLKGMIVKWVPETVYTETYTGATSGTTVVLADAPYQCFEPTLLGGYTAAGAYVTPSTATTSWSATAGSDGLGRWTATFASGILEIIYAYGQKASMIAGEVYGLETLDDLPGYLKWVKDNFGAWSLPLMYPNNSTSTSTTPASSAMLSLGNGAFSFAKDGTSPVYTRIDASKPITVKLATGCIYADENNDLQTTSALTTLPAADFEGADYTQGKNYNINPITGTIQFFGVYDSDMGALETDDFTVTFYAESTATSRSANVYEPRGLVGLTDGSLNGVVGTEPQYNLTGAIGILRVAIH